MTTGLTVTVNDQPVPLDECGWLQRRPCGCIVSAVVAVVECVDDSGWVLATADQAHRHLNPTKRDRAKADRAGLTTELITMRHYRDHIGAQWECEQHRTPKPVPSAPAASEVVHACPPDGSGLTPCCGRTPFELPRTDRMTTDPAEATCAPVV